MKLENRDLRYMIRMKPSEKDYLRREADERGLRSTPFRIHSCRPLCQRRFDSHRR